LAARSLVVSRGAWTAGPGRFRDGRQRLQVQHHCTTLAGCLRTVAGWHGKLDLILRVLMLDRLGRCDDRSSHLSWSDTGPAPA
jgi:hypothetical protein